MAELNSQYIVRPGDSLVKVAYTLKFDADAVWNDPKNEDLKRLRPDPNILAPGDILYVPEAPPDGLDLQKGTDNSYAADVPTTDIQIAFADASGPIANEPYEVHGLEGDPVTGTTGADGSVKVTVPVVTREVRIVIPGRNTSYAVGVGDLDPIETDSGVRQRLAHLGYLPSPSNVDADVLASAVGSFQSAQSLDVTGTMDDATRAALKAAHGGH